ncbi:MAG: hypothetical protein GX574_15555 [Lentisphaerae bacterium]|nr:hypothetical protein [Lentisphaerota bacterium]OQC12455.1 MAG: hypothetical protein BWX73_02949 [Lentisphaerae bacterium ADurb.Bin082]
MPLSPSMKAKVAAALEDFKSFKTALRARCPYVSCETADPDADLGGQCPPKPEAIRWARELKPASDKLDVVLGEAVAELTAGLPAPPPISRDKLWLWGGPTPYWCGSTDEDTLVTGADYFNAKNVVYVYGPVNEKMLAKLKKYDKVLCQVTSNCRSPGAQVESDAECAEKTSRLALQFPNLVGGLMDDSMQHSQKYSYATPGDRFRDVNAALKKHKKDMILAGVIYVHEFEQYDFSGVLPHFDVVNLWFWFKHELLELDDKIAQCRKLFPGKKILLGCFIHDYGLTDLGNAPVLLNYQLSRAAQHLQDGVIDGVVILGDREIRKWPASTAAVKDFLDR